MAHLHLGAAANEVAGVGVIILHCQLGQLQLAFQAHLFNRQLLLKGLLHNCGAVLACAHMELDCGRPGLHTSMQC